MRGKQYNSRKAPCLSVIHDLIEHHAEVLERCRALALKGDDGAEEAIHKARVTTRRLQAVTEFLQLGSRADRGKSARKRLRKFRGSLSYLRNCDVFLGLLARAQEKAATSDSPKLELLAQHLRLRRDKAALKSRRTLQEFDAQGVKSELQALVRVASVQADAETEQKIAEKVFQSLELRFQQFTTLASKPETSSDTDGLHRLRIGAKRLRYLLESLGPLGYAEPKGALRWLRGLQSKIGQWHDLESLEQEVIRIVRKRGFLERNLSEGSRLLEAAWIVVRHKQQNMARTFPVIPSRFFTAGVQRALDEVQRSLPASTIP